jgi:hypothetical protein
MKNCLKLMREFFKFPTDSIIFISNENHYEPELADYLGKLTNEIQGGNFIKVLINYGYKLNNGQTSCKIKAFSVHFIVSESLNFQ